MRASKTLRKIMIDRGVKIKALSEMTGKSPRTLYNTFYNDENSKGSGMTFEKVVELCDALECDVIFRDRETGKEYMASEQKRKTYKYGMRLRGFAPMCQPMEGLIEQQDDPDRIYHDILIYSRPLTKKELEEYELDNLN